MQIQAVRFGFWGKKQEPKPEEKKQERAGPLGPPPRPGYTWNEQRQKWQNPETGAYWTEILADGF